VCCGACSGVKNQLEQINVWLTLELINKLLLRIHSNGTDFMEPLVSILIPAYNAEEWISDTIQSALDQTWPRKEIIIVNDGSKDGTLAVARRFAFQQCCRHGHENQGAAGTRNTAFPTARGIMFNGWMRTTFCARIKLRARCIWRCNAAMSER
jgi:glycosyltransferase involved in cell wall biosynthesis